MPSSYNTGGTIYLKFTTRAFSTGLPTTFAGSPVISIYKDGSTTASVAGVTLTVDFNARTGLNHVAVNTAADTTFYANGHSYWAIVTAGTVGGTSIVGEIVGAFDLVPPAVPALDAVIYPAAGTVSLVSATSTSATFDALASNVPQAYQWDVLNILTGTGAGQSRVITNYTSGRVATINPPWTTTPDNTSGYNVTPTASVQVVSYATGQDPATLVLDAQQSAHVAAGTIGLNISNLDATISSRLAASSYTAAPTVAAIDAQLSGTHGAGSWLTGGAGITTAQIWGDLLAGSDFGTAGSIGALLKANIDAAISSRLATSGYTAPISLGQLLSAPRNLNTVPDNQLTVNDALYAALAQGCGKETIDPLNLLYTVMTPFTGTTLRVFALDRYPGPLSRT